MKRKRIRKTRQTKKEINLSDLGIIATNEAFKMSKKDLYQFLVRQYQRALEYSKGSAERKAIVFNIQQCERIMAWQS